VAGVRLVVKTRLDLDLKLDQRLLLLLLLVVIVLLGGEQHATPFKREILKTQKRERERRDSLAKKEFVQTKGYIEKIKSILLVGPKSI
jgi:hypothetical protein